MDKPSLRPPQQKPENIEHKYRLAKQDLETAFKQFHALLGDKVLDENKSPGKKKSEHAIVNELVKTAIRLNDINSQEGTFAIAIISLRENLKIRDRVNSLEYKLELAYKEIEKLKAEKMPRK